MNRKQCVSSWWCVTMVVSILSVPLLGNADIVKMQSISGKVDSVNVVKGTVVIGNVELLVHNNTRIYLDERSQGLDRLTDLRTGYTVSGRYLKDGRPPFALDSLRLISTYSTYKMPEL